MKSKITAILLLLVCSAAVAGEGTSQTPLPEPKELTSVEELIREIDRQMTFETRRLHARMVIIDEDGRREKWFRVFARGADDALIQFYKPARDKGTKMLRLGKQLWIYLPRTEKVIKIAGHLLRQSLMGSDFSYEDMTENRELLDDYDGQLLKPKTIDGEECYVVELQERKRGMSYPKRKLWISKRHLLPLREERYAKSGRLLKVVEFKKIERFENRWYPTLFVMRDALRRDSHTEMWFDKIEFKIELPNKVFDRRNLRRESRF